MVRDLAALDRNSLDAAWLRVDRGRWSLYLCARASIACAPRRLRGVAVEALAAGGLRSARKEVEVEKLRRKLKGTREEEVDQA